MIFFTPEQVKTHGGRRGERRPGSPRRHLQQGQGQGRGVTLMATVAAPRGAAASEKRAPAGAPKFGLALPSWVWYLGVLRRPGGLSSSSTASGYKPPVNAGRADRPRPTLARELPRRARHERPASRRSSQTLRRRGHRHGAVPAHRLPVRLLDGREGAAEVAGPGARARDRAVLDELPHPHGRVAHRAGADGFFSDWLQTVGAARHARSASSTRARRCRSASSTTTCR